MDKRTATVLVAVLALVAGAGIAVAAFSNPVPVDNGVPLGSGNGLVVTIDGSTQADLENFTAGSDTIDLRTVDGNVTVQADGAASVTIHKDDITGTWTRATGISASFNAITINPEDKQAATVGGDIENVSFRAAAGVAADDGTPDFIYGGPSGTSRVTIQGAPADTQLGAVDADSKALLDVATSTSNGEITFDSLSNSDHTVTLQTSDGAPTIDNASPQGDLDSPPSDISADIDDPDFPSDNVTVRISLDGSRIHEETISSSQSVSTAIPSSGQTAGEHSYTINATDAYGQSQISTYSYRVPDTLYIRDEQDHSRLLDNQTHNVTLFAESGNVYTRQTSDATVDLTGLPVNQNFNVRIEPSDSQNWTTRTVFIDSIYQQQDAYLLNKTDADTVEVRFRLEDPTGQFGSSTVLFIEKAINVSGTTSYQSIAADEFGAEGVTAVLEQGQRYRLRIKNQQGTTQVIGPYRADVSETVTVRPGTPTIGIGELTDGWAANAALDNRTLTWRYADPAGETDQLTVSIYQAGNPSNQLVDNETYFDLGNASRQLALDENESQVTWVVQFEVDRNGETFTTTERVSNRPEVLPDLAREWRLITGILLLVLSAGAFSLLNAPVGAIVVSAEGGLLWWIGWLDGATSGILVVLSMFIAVMVNLYSSGRR